ncbi:MAG: 3,5-nucleoside bisphosphate phosphatase [Thermotogaceae bacterium]|jgi:hypothetical protein|nr:3,5-nucleoside bisphosphate phosphatase [Thermotogaceae bacterium]MDN5337842.1 3,5-nucleoside bisphosphate phosphatase [Thermotogaceae bacterium]
MVPNILGKKLQESGIDWIAITDHNSTKNVRVFKNVLRKYGVEVLPGIEVQTIEEVHVLGYFKDVDTAEEFGEFIYSKLPDFEIDEERFGYQLLVNENDEYIERETKNLSLSVNLNLEQVVKELKKFNALVAYAHVDRAFGVLYQLGLIPENLKVDALEFRKGRTVSSEFSLPVLVSSDAHNLDSISQPSMAVECERRTYEEFFKALKGLGERRLIIESQNNR